MKDISSRITDSFSCAGVVSHGRLLRTAFTMTTLLPLLAACASNPKYNSMPALPEPVEAPQYYQYKMEEDYLIQVADKLVIQSYYDEQLNQTAIVRPDGRISLVLVGEVDAANKPPRALSKEISLAYAKHLKNPDINVVVNEIAPRRMYIGGQVRSPSVHNIASSLTLMQALTLSGGFNDSANNHVLLLRQEESGLKVHQIDTNRILANEIPDVFLTRNDMVYVPRSRIADQGLWVEQYLNNMIPDFLHFNVNYQLGTLESEVDQKTNIVSP